MSKICMYKKKCDLHELYRSLWDTREWMCFCVPYFQILWIIQYFLVTSDLLLYYSEIMTFMLSYVLTYLTICFGGCCAQLG